MALPFDQLVAEVFVAGLFLGINFVPFTKALRWLLWADEGWKFRRKVDWVMVIITLVIFGSTATKMAFIVQTTMVAVMEKPPENSGGAVDIEAASWADIIDCTTANVPVLLADAVLLYRLWLVYTKSYRVVIFPILLWLGTLACTILQVFWQTVQVRGIATSWHPVSMTIGAGPILTPFWGATMVLNIYATIMIWRGIWLTTKATEGASSTRSLDFLMRVLIESGFIYIIVSTSHFVIWWTPSMYAISLVATMNTPMIGIAFNLIIIRTYENRARENAESSHEPRTSTLEFKVPTLKSTDLHTHSLVNDDTV